MSKTKTPLISLGAEGTIGDSLTFQKRGGLTIVRKKPTPAYRLTLAQQYQRWLFEDYIELWHEQTQVVRDSWRAAGARQHMSAYAAWMRYHLKNLPDIAGWWRLDDNSGATVVDSSRNSNTGTVFGASPIEGLIDGAMHFDGINDYINLGTKASLNFNAPITVEGFLNVNPAVGTDPWYKYSTNWVDNTFGWYLGIGDNAAIAFRWGDGTFPPQMIGTAPGVCIFSETHHLAWTYDLITTRIFYKGQLVKELAKTKNIVPSPVDLKLQIYPAQTVAIHDNFRIYNRALTPNTILRHSERRYPT